MRTILYVSLTANGFVFQPGEGRPIPPEVLANFRESIQHSGNVINGRRTYEMARASRQAGVLNGIKHVVVSDEMFEAEDAHVVPSPAEALDYLETQGFDTALVGGGAGLDASFLSQGLVDELYLNIVPVLSGPGLAVPASPETYASLELLGSTSLGSGIQQLHYAVAK